LTFIPINSKLFQYCICIEYDRQYILVFVKKSKKCCRLEKKMKQDRARRPDLFLVVQLHKRTRVSSQAYL